MADVLWNAYCTEDGEPWAAFVQGHVDIRTIADDACDKIVEEFGVYGEECADDAKSAIDDAGGLILKHFWLKPAAEEDMYRFAEEGDEGAFPVTGMRFM